MCWRTRRRRCWRGSRVTSTPTASPPASRSPVSWTPARCWSPATFGAGEVASDEEHDEPERSANRLSTGNLRVRLADRSLRQTNPVLGVVAQLLELGEQRLTASQVLDLADREAVRHRFRLDDDDLGRLQNWVTQAGIRPRS